jgi:Fe(3+) dicitrate transport protein
VNINGLELAASHIIPIGQKFIPLHLSYTFTSTEFLNSFESNFEAWGTVMAGDELPYVPKHQLFSEAGLEDRAWSSYIRFRLIDAMRTVAGSGGIDSDFSTDVVVLFDFSAEISISSTSRLFFKMNNIFNNHSVAAARPAGVRPTMPRNIMAGVKIIL